MTAPRPLYSRERTLRAHCIGGWVGPTAGPNDWGREESVAPTVSQTPDSPARSLVTGQTALSVPETLQFLESGLCEVGYCV